MAQREIINDRQDNTVLLPCLFTDSSIRTRTAGGGHFLQADYAVQDATLPGGLFAFSQEGKGGLCEHHAAHMDDCGYTEEAPETPCTYISYSSCRRWWLSSQHHPLSLRILFLAAPH